jgi:hypothetical protein
MLKGVIYESNICRSSSDSTSLGTKGASALSCIPYRHIQIPRHIPSSSFPAKRRGSLRDTNYSAKGSCAEYSSISAGSAKRNAHVCPAPAAS